MGVDGPDRHCLGQRKYVGQADEVVVAVSVAVVAEHDRVLEGCVVEAVVDAGSAPVAKLENQRGSDVMGVVVPVAIYKQVFE